MRKLVITQNITLDGSVEMLDDWFDPQLQDEDLLEESHRQDSQADALLVGRQTFEDFRGYWPKQTDDPTGVTGYLNRLFVYPTVQGRGRRLFPGGTAIPKLTLVEPPKSFRSGITLLRYAA